MDSNSLAKTKIKGFLKNKSKGQNFRKLLNEMKVFRTEHCQKKYVVLKIGKQK